jgi:hypothetical protein
MTASVSPEVIEKWRDEFESRRIANHPCPCLDRDEAGNYVAIHAWVAWSYWLAARQSVVIELPKMETPADNEFINGAKTAIANARKMIESQGYRVEVKGD